ncbi:serum response factor-binding protein 1 [Halyomorpha halys]|uniref:serum response factor-binding protein 1 n=1 Tax=Halyomorpha halys TaxID=286706 RepID=UPI0006D518C4|nr:serum response factor-binding protein 1 [Halyomorpha halys]
MELLTTKRLNDQIVLMRKEVKRAIVHQIHRLTTAAKRLRSKKGTEEQKEKNAIKADNMVAEICLLKKMKPDDVSVFGLTNFEEIEVKNFISKRVIAPETKAMAKLCLRKNLRSVIDQFIKEIGSAQSRLMELLDERQQHKEKKDKKKLKEKGKNEESNHAYDDTSDSTLDSSESIPDLVPAQSDHESSDEKIKLLDIIKNEEKNGIENKLNIFNRVKREETRKKPVQEEKNFQDSTDADSDSDFIEHVEKGINEHSNDKQEDKHTEFTKMENKPLERKNIDPFFMTRDNSEYRTYCDIGANAKKDKDVSDKTNLDDDDDNDDKNFKNNYKKGNYNKKNNLKDDSFNRNKNNQRFDSRKTITYLGGSDRKSFDKKGFRRGEKRPSMEDPQSNVKLHPSWEAKKKLSVSTVPFQGKKITFDD